MEPKDYDQNERDNQRERVVEAILIFVIVSGILMGIAATLVFLPHLAGWVTGAITLAIIALILGW